MHRFKVESTIKLQAVIVPRCQGVNDKFSSDTYMIMLHICLDFRMNTLKPSPLSLTDGQVVRAGVSMT